MFKKILTSSLLTLVAFGGFFWVSLEQWNNINGDKTIVASIGTSETYAADDCSWPNPPVPCLNANQDVKTKEMLNNLVAWINIVLDIVTIFVTPAIMLASWLMSPDWTAGDLFGIRPTLHNLWITVSNITYFIYAILLIFIAIATIFNSEHYGYKAMLPKLALGIILVPLTWFGVQFTVSVATYITAAAISVPYESISKFSEKDAWWTTPSIPKNNEYDNDKSKDSKTAENTKCPENCISPEQFVKKSWWLFSPLVIYGFSVFKIQEVKKINTISDTATSVFNIINQGIVGALMFLVYGLLVLALIFMLMMRAMKLWFYAIFSPLFTIKYVLGDKWFGEADKDGSFKITEFIGLAFVPAIVSLALWFWLIIVSALISPMNGSKNNDNKCTGTTCTIVIMWNKENTIETKDEKTEKWTITTTKVSIGWVNYTWKWSVSASEWTTAGIKSALWATGNLFGTVVIDILALVFIWVAFMAGKWVSKAAWKAIEPFENMGRKIGELGMSLPKYAPIPGTGGMSAKSFEKMPTMVEDGFRKRSDESFENSDAGKILKKWSGSADAADLAKYRDASHKEWSDAVGSMKSALNYSHGNWNGGQIITDSNIKKFVDEFASKVGNGKITKANLETEYDSVISRKLFDKLKDGKINSEEDRKIISAWMAGNKDADLTASNAEAWLKDGKKVKSWTEGSTNNTFHIWLDWSGKYSLKAWQIDTNMELSKDELLKRIENNISQLKDTSEDTIRSQLKNIATDDQIKNILKKLEESKKS